MDSVVGNDPEDAPAVSPTPRGRGERGANLVEYTLLIALIVLACLAGVSQFGKEVPSESFLSVSAAI